LEIEIEIFQLYLIVFVYLSRPVFRHLLSSGIWPARLCTNVHLAAITIAMADGLGLPVSTTQVLSSGIAGTMAANGSGLQGSTVRNILLAWVLTLPVSILLAGLLFALLRVLI
jgi:phosphate/sulfate permease